MRDGFAILGMALKNPGWLLLGVLLISCTAGEAQERAVPYWASIAAGAANLRTGPARTYPAIWRYRRRDLPVQVVQVYGNWRRIREQDGTEGWMLSTLLSAQRTAVVTGTGPAPMYADPSSSSALDWRAEPGVVGKISKCRSGWCLFDVAGKRGYIRTERIFGVDPGEIVE
jgi:SH3-like domain-containing protein